MNRQLVHLLRSEGGASFNRLIVLFLRVLLDYRHRPQDLLKLLQRGRAADARHARLVLAAPRDEHLQRLVLFSHPFFAIFPPKEQVWIDNVDIQPD